MSYQHRPHYVSHAPATRTVAGPTRVIHGHPTTVHAPAAPLRFHTNAAPARVSNTSSVPFQMRDSYTESSSTHQFQRPQNPVYTQAAPVPQNQTYVSSAPVQPRSQVMSRSTITVDDEERYRRVAGEMHGYGRNKEGKWLGNSNHTFNKRLDKRFQATIVDNKTNADEYRYDPYCTLI